MASPQTHTYLGPQSMSLFGNGKWGLCRCDHIKMGPYEVRMGPESDD